MTVLRVVICDDEPLVRQGLRMVLELDPGLEVVAEAADGATAIELVRRHRPDLALMDVRMPGMGGIDATRLICRASVLAVAEGRTTLAPTLLDRLLREYADRQAPQSPALARLTERETDVLREIAGGSSNLEIAEALFVSEGTVKTHVAAILRKLDLRDRTQAAVAAYELGLVRPRG